MEEKEKLMQEITLFSSFSNSLKKPLVMTRFEQAKNIDIEKYFQTLGIQEKSKNCYHIDEHKVYLNTEINRINCFTNESLKGSIIDLVCYIKNETPVNSVNLLLNDSEMNKYIHTPKPKTEKGSIFKVINTYDNNRPIDNYLLSRKVHIQNALNIGCKIVYFENINTRKKMFGLGIKNVKDNWVVKTSLDNLKTVCIGSNDISVIKGSDNVISIYEGLFDVLSHIEIGMKYKDSTIIILNGVGNFKTEYIQGLNKYKKVLLYLDNDNAGSELTNKILKEVPQSKDKRKYYSNYKDLNDYIMNK